MYECKDGLGRRLRNFEGMKGDGPLFHGNLVFEEK